MLRANDISVSYGERVAVSGVSLELKPRHITAIIGPNGAGKSTMLRTLNGGMKPTAGQVSLDGQPLN